MSTHSISTTRILAACVALALLFAACSDSGSGDDTATAGNNTAAEAADNVASGAAGDAGVEDAVAFLSSPVMGDLWRDGPFEGVMCESIDPPTRDGMQQQWNCTAENTMLNFKVGIDLDDRMFVSGDITPQAGRMITIDLVEKDLREDHGYEIDGDYSACGSRSFADGTYEYNCEAELPDGRGLITYRIAIEDASLGEASPYEVLDVTGP